MKNVLCIRKVITLKLGLGDDANYVIKELFKSFLQRYQEGLEEKMKGSEFEFDGFNLMY